MDFDDEVFSVPVDAADLVEATVLVVTGLIASSVASQAVRWRDCSLLGVEPCRTPRGKPPTPSPTSSGGMLTMACGYVSAEMNVFLLVRVSLEVQERMGAIWVAVLIVCETDPGSPGCLFTHDSVPL